MIKWIIVLAILIGMNNIYAQLENYFPLAIGNQWEYYTGYSYRFGEIEKDTLYKNGNKYFILPFSISELHFARQDSSGNVYSIESMFNPYQYDSVEAFVYNNNAQLNETWVVSKSGPPRYDTIWGKYVYSGIQQVFNQQRKIKGVVIYNSTIELVTYFFAEGIGVVRKEFDDGTTLLIDYAKIDSVTYGKILDVEKINSPPNSFIVSQNYPNPFNNRTRIDINIPSEAENQGEVEFLISDILGNIIYRNKYSTTINNQSLRIDLNADELRLTSGIYFYTIRFGKSSISNKMTYLK